MLDYPQPEVRAATVLERLVSAGISEGRARELVEMGRVRVGEELVRDPEASLPWPSAYVLV